MTISLSRTFSPAVEEFDEHSWARYLSSRSSDLSWEDIQARSVVVVLGEAGTGKTVEFSNRVTELRNQGQFALFVQLNAIIDANNWSLSPADASLFRKWISSDQPGYLFLDAIDESRLADLSAFRRALEFVYTKVEQNLKNTRFVLSSRHSDWAVVGVQNAVHDFLTLPGHSARIAASGNDEGSASTEVVERTSPVLLKPLSKDDREKLARFFGLESEAEFWSSVLEGDYLEMAARPRDLQWLVDYWKNNGKLGSYLELMHDHISNRLTEKNESYIASKVVLSPLEMREGAEDLAIAAEMCGKPFFSLSDSPQENELRAHDVLNKWAPHSVDYLLKSAAFNLATYERVQFSHRSIREYLAGSWVVRKYNGGVPFESLCGLFYSNSYGQELLIPSRRYALCWACAMHPDFRQWAAAKFPEVYAFDGDPAAWDSATAEQALSGFIRLLAEGRNKDWWNSQSELRRAVTPLRSSFFSNLLRQYIEDDTVCPILLQYVLHGGADGCKSLVEEIFATAPHDSYRYRMALATLAEVGDANAKQLLKSTLMSRAYAGKNKLIAEALAGLGLSAFNLTELINVFEQTASEDRFGNGDMAREVGEMVVEETNIETVEMVLQAVLECMPESRPSRRFVAGEQMSQANLEWLYSVLPKCFERLLMLLPPTADCKDLYIDSAQRVDGLRYTEFAIGERLKRIRELIAQHPLLRWRLTEVIATADAANNRSNLGGGGLVTLCLADLETVIGLANDIASSEPERDIWFRVAGGIIFRELRGKPRRGALSRLIVGDEAAKRAASVNETLNNWIHGRCTARNMSNEGRRNRQERNQAHRAEWAWIDNAIEKIRAGDSATLTDAVRKMANEIGTGLFEEAGLALVERRFSKEIAEAMYMGLAIYFSKLEIPDPSQSSGGNIPWEVLLAMTFSNAQAKRGGWNPAPIAKLARLEVWVPNGPSEDFKALCIGNEATVVEALSDWVLAEARIESAGKGVHSALKFSMRLPERIKIPLLRKLKSLPMPQVTRHPTHRVGLFDDMAEGGVLTLTEQASIARAEVFISAQEGVLFEDFTWYRRWLFSEPLVAWDWFCTHLDTVESQRSEQLNEFAQNIGSLKPEKGMDGPVYADTLYRIYELLRPLASPFSEVRMRERGSVDSLVGAIPNLLASVPGEPANLALSRMAATAQEEVLRTWLKSLVYAQAAFGAQLSTVVTPADLRALVEEYEAEPVSEAQLLKQVLARLGEIRRAIERGPFSDRRLFKAKTPEKDTQLWLAARLAERSPMKRFTVQREEEVDDDKKTDIQLGTGKGFTVCIEIKPVERYSASELVSTMKDQLIGQYLKGNNSAHGILVLFRLDAKKRWKIPGYRKYQPFEVLLPYLETEAARLRKEHNTQPNIEPVEALKIFAIRCFAE